MASFFVRLYWLMVKNGHSMLASLKETNRGSHGYYTPLHLILFSVIEGTK